MREVVATPSYDSPMRIQKSLVVSAAVLAIAATGCAPKSEAPKADGSKAPAVSCAMSDLALKTKGQLTVGTDSPAYPPWFQDNKPANGKGFESAVAYAVAEQLGFTADQVKWVKVPFNNSYAPGAKNFDFDINQISVTPEREQKVSFSDGYYFASQAIIALKSSKIASASTVADLKNYKLGAQTGTTSLTAIRETVKPSADPLVFDDTNVAKRALLNGQVDAIVADLPTALYITAVEIPKAKIVGQFKDPNNAEHFGLLSEKGSKLTPCLNDAIAKLTEDGTLKGLEEEWIPETTSVPVLTN